MVMVPYHGERFITCLTRAVDNGDVPLARIDDAVRRILAVKVELGLFECPFGDESLLPLVGSRAHRAVAREAVRKSLVLLKNDDHTLPLAKDTPLILVAGAAADDVGLQCGGWTIEWQGKAGDVTSGTTLVTAVEGVVSKSTTVRYDTQGEFGDDDGVADVGIVVLSEEPYAEGEGDREDLHLSHADAALLARVRHCCGKLVVILISGRPLIVTEHLPQWDAFIAAWLPGTEGQGVADVLFGDFPFTGKLPHTWPRSMDQVPLSELIRGGGEPLLPFGYGLP
jgi:beta-glucosidase